MSNDGTKERRRLGRLEGAARRDREMLRMEVSRRPIITTMRRAFVAALLEKGHELPADYVYELVTMPSDWNPKLMGSVFLGLSLAGVIRAVGWVRSSRPKRHAGTVRTWNLVSLEAGIAWLAANPEPPEPSPAMPAATPPPNPSTAPAGSPAASTPCPVGDPPGDQPPGRPAELIAQQGQAQPIPDGLFDDDRGKTAALQADGWLMAGTKGNRR